MQTPRASRAGSDAVAKRAAAPGRVLPHAAVWLVWAISGVGVTIGVLALVYRALNYRALDQVLTRVAPKRCGPCRFHWSAR
jgi:hypothetical protein